MKLLILTSRFPFPLDKGDKLRIYYQIRELSKHFELVLVSITDNDPGEADIAELRSFCKSIYTIRHKRIKSVLNTIYAIAILSKTPAQCAYFYSPRIKNKIDSIISAESPDHIYCQLIRTAEYVKDVEIPKTVDLMDAFSTGAAMRAEKGNMIQKWFWNRESELVKSFESRTSDYFDHITIISQLDRERLKHVRELHVVNNGIDSGFFEENEIEASFDAVFVGNLGYYPNIRAVRYIAEHVIPVYNSAYNRSLKVNIVGPNGSRVKEWENKDLQVGGWYEDVKEGFGSGRVFLAPLFEGIGQQNKILEAMAIGIPCVTTPDVAKALGMKHGNQLLVATTGQSFSDCIHQLMTDKSFADDMIDRARNFVRSNYEWSAVCLPLIKLIKGSKE